MQGTRLGPYEIVEQLGAGGMGEVWLAQDTRLGRKVAVKVLPEQFASDPERLARFEQEARAAAALNHPHIAAVFDVGAEQGERGTVHYMVQEFLDGHSLRTVLEQGRMPLPRALELATEITEALAAAHRAGIVHRDLKPDNVFVTADGHAKVLDFGLAKLTEIAGGPAGDQSMSPTILGTQAGAIMGTAGYMAPEQVNAQEVDARADLFAFGCLLYEMASGKRAFAGQSLIQTLNRIAHEEPAALQSLDGSLPAELQRIVRKCLAKSPARRYQTAGDLTVDLLNLGADVEAGRISPVAQPSTDTAGTPSTNWTVAALVAIGGLLLGGAIAWMLRPAPPPPPNGVVRFGAPVPTDIIGFDNGNQQVVAISPDGQRIAAVVDNYLWVRALHESEPTALRGTEDPRSPSFSPDSTQVAFWADNQIKRVAVSGGSPVVVGPAPGRPLGVTWASDGFIYVGASDGQRIVRLPDTGGQPESVLEAGEDGVETERQLYGPRLLPGGDWLMFTQAISTGWDGAQIAVQSLRTGERRVLFEGGHDARYAPTGHLLYVNEGVLLAVRFDLDALEVSGGPVPLVEGVRVSSGQTTGAAFYSIADNGNLIYVPGGGSAGNLLEWVDRNGGGETIPLPPASYDSSISLSPDGKTLAAELFEAGGNHIWVYDLERANGQRLSTATDSEEPVWSPDGQYVYFNTNRDTPAEDIWRRRADLSQPEEPVLVAEGYQVATSISADGEWLYYVQRTDGPTDIYRTNLREPGDPEPVVASPAAEYGGMVSPDGAYLLYRSNETGRTEHYVLELASGRRWNVSAAAGASAWSPATSEIILRDLPGYFAVPYEMDPEFRPGVPRKIADHPDGRQVTDMVLTPDGQRFLARTNAADRDIGDAVVEVVLNWFDELRSRAPVER